MWETYVGQEKIKHELINLIPYDVPIMLRGASGYGKTTLARLFCQSVGAYEELSGDIINKYGLTVDTWARIHLVDEAHVIKEVEVFYPLMDAGIRFIFCSNEGVNLKEPLLNRCVVRYLTHYTDEELRGIIKLNNSDLLPEIIDLIVDRCRRVPRTALQLAFLIKVNSALTLESATEYLTGVGYFEGGYTQIDLDYLAHLKELGKASLNTMYSVLVGSSKEQIVNEVERFLLLKNRIRITSKGRELI